MRTSSELIEKSVKKLFKAALDVTRCLRSLLPPERDSFGSSLERRVIALFTLVRTNLHKESYIVICLFNYTENDKLCRMND